MMAHVLRSMGFELGFFKTWDPDLGLELDHSTDPIAKTGLQVLEIDAVGFPISVELRGCWVTVGRSSGPFAAGMSRYQ